MLVSELIEKLLTIAGNSGCCATGSDPELMATLCASDNDKFGCNQW